jgi:hypothetical protein
VEFLLAVVDVGALLLIFVTISAIGHTWEGEEAIDDYDYNYLGCFIEVLDFI